MWRRLLALSCAAIFVFGMDLYFALKKGREFIEDVRKDVEALPNVKGQPNE